MAGSDDRAFDAFRKAAESPLPAMYGVRVYYHLAQAYKQTGDAEQASSATAKMMSARSGLEAWKPLQKAMEGTAYGQALHYEIAAIEEAIAQADLSSLG
jgi:predicted Zn-dependent protease